jgi:hypothetical protein
LRNFDTYTSTPNFQIGRRKVRRVKLRIGFTVTGFDQYGVPFTDQVQTENVSRTGGCLVFDRDLRRNQFIRLEARNGMQFPARVRWCVHVNGILHRCGFELNPISQKNNGWVITDPTHQRPKSGPELAAESQLWFSFVEDDSNGSSDSSR